MYIKESKIMREQESKIIMLVEQLDLPVRTKIMFTDKETGAGYVCYGDRCTNDTVLVRWSTYESGIRVLQLYLDAYHQYPNA